jgi:hypothetical protein
MNDVEGLWHRLIELAMEKNPERLRELHINIVRLRAAYQSQIKVVEHENKN